eukprot:scaffold8764_cov73-Skeletonema_marinoi.AAC.1
MGLHSRHSVEQSDISDTASDQESSNISNDNKNIATGNTLDNVRQEKGIDTRRNEMDGQSKEDEGIQDKIQYHLPAKRPL